MRKHNIAAIFLAGLLAGLLFAQGLVVLTGRRAGNFGGELLILPLVGLLVYVGVQLGLALAADTKQRE